MSFEQLERAKHQFLPKEMYHLYRKDEIPKELEGKGIWQRYGDEVLFSPFGGNIAIESNVNRFDWKCHVCGWLEQWSVIKMFRKYKCPNCGSWARRW